MQHLLSYRLHLCLCPSFPGELGLAGIIEAKDDGSGGDNWSWSLVTICSDACPLSCISAETCLTGWPNAQGRRDGKLVNAALLSLMRRV